MSKFFDDMSGLSPLTFLFEEGNRRPIPRCPNGPMPPIPRFKPFACDVRETDTAYIVEAELPGFKKEDMNVNMDDGVLSITAEIKNENEDNKDSYVRRERFYGKFSRSFKFDNVKDDTVKAKYADGVLTIEIEKTQPVEKNTKVNIE